MGVRKQHRFQTPPIFLLKLKITFLNEKYTYLLPNPTFKKENQLNLSPAPKVLLGFSRVNQLVNKLCASSLISLILIFLIWKWMFQPRNLQVISPDSSSLIWWYALEGNSKDDAQNVAPWPAALVSPGKLLEIQIPGLFFISVKSEAWVILLQAEVENCCSQAWFVCIVKQKQELSNTRWLTYFLNSTKLRKDI